MLYDHTNEINDMIGRLIEMGYDLMTDKSDISDVKKAHLQFHNELNGIYIYVDFDMIVKMWIEDVNGQRPCFVHASIISILHRLLNAWAKMITSLQVQNERLQEFFKLEKFKNSDDSEVLPDEQD